MKKGIIQSVLPLVYRSVLMARERSLMLAINRSKKSVKISVRVIAWKDSWSDGVDQILAIVMEREGK